jgi:hypothetical protein
MREKIKSDFDPEIQAIQSDLEALNAKVAESQAKLDGLIRGKLFAPENRSAEAEADANVDAAMEPVMEPAPAVPQTGQLDLNEGPKKKK